MSYLETHIFLMTGKTSVESLINFSHKGVLRINSQENRKASCFSSQNRYIERGSRSVFLILSLSVAVVHLNHTHRCVKPFLDLELLNNTSTNINPNVIPHHDHPSALKLRALAEECGLQSEGTPEELTLLLARIVQDHSPKRLHIPQYRLEREPLACVTSHFFDLPSQEAQGNRAPTQALHTDGLGVSPSPQGGPGALTISSRSDETLPQALDTNPTVVASRLSNAVPLSKPEDPRRHEVVMRDALTRRALHAAVQPHEASITFCFSRVAVTPHFPYGINMLFSSCMSNSLRV